MKQMITTILLILALGPAAQAVEPGEMMDDPAQEQRARVISKELRCMVCQNQDIDSSNAELARDLRLLVRERIRAGDTNEEVLDYVHDRYGDFVLMRPPVNSRTWLLWFGPALVLLGGGVMLRNWLKRSARNTPAPLSKSEEDRLARLMRDEGGAP